MQDYREIIGAYPGHTLARHGRTRLIRVLGSDTQQTASPFMLLEAIETRTQEDLAGGFPWHPYKGIESFLYFLDATRDGNRASNPDSAGWVYSADGEFGDELPQFNMPVIGTQLWVWAGDKPAVPSLSHSPGHTVLPKVSLGPATIRVIAGSFADQIGAIILPKSGITYLDIFVEPKAEFVLESFQEDQLLAYVLEGDAFFNFEEDELYPQGRALMFSPGQKLYVHPTHRGVRFLLAHIPAAAGDVPPLDENAVKQAEREWEEIVEEQPRR